MVKVNQKTCIGCGNCAAVCSEVFEITDGKSQVKSGQENSDAPCVRQAIESCPVDAIGK